MLKKVIIYTLASLVILFSFPSSVKVSAVSVDTVTAPSAILMESTTGKIIFEKNSHEKRPCASVTKVMTLLLVFEAIDSGKLSLDDTITASEHAASMGGSDIWLEPGEKMSADDMIKATVVASANDAAVALAEHISGSEEAFIENMNKRAKELKMNDTVFKNCNGLDEEGHVTSAYDVAIMSKELIKHEKIFDYSSIWLDTLRDGKTQIVNTNKLLKTYNGITGLKTGTTDDAGCCMSATAQRGDVSLIAVVLGCDTGKERFADAAALLDYGFANISVVELELPEDMPSQIKVDGGMESSVQINCPVSSKVVVDKGREADIKSTVKLSESVAAPVEENQKLGTIIYTVDGKTVSECDITAASCVEEISYISVLGEIFNSVITL